MRDKAHPSGKPAAQLGKGERKIPLENTSRKLTPEERFAK